MVLCYRLIDQFAKADRRQRLSSEDAPTVDEASVIVQPCRLAVDAGYRRRSTTVKLLAGIA